MLNGELVRLLDPGIFTSSRAKVAKATGILANGTKLLVTAHCQASVVKMEREIALKNITVKMSQIWTPRT